MSDLANTLPAPTRPTLNGPRLAILDQARAFTGQPAVRRSLPFAGAFGAIAAAGLAWTYLSAPPQRVLYSELGDSEKAAVAQSLDKAAIAYKLDPTTGAITVNESDIYKARMVVASDGSVASPNGSNDLIDNMPIGASRVVEAERLRAARERELERTIMEIDGVESVRVHLAQPEKSVFVRDSSPPRASVMLKLARGRQLSAGQINAIVNLVTGSVPALSADDVKVVDQRGQLLTDQKNDNPDGNLDIQSRLEDKMRAQITQLLTPIYGDGNFSTEVQVELDMNATTSARESWNKDGALRSETSASTTAAGGDNSTAGGIPGTLSSAPPPPTEVVKNTPKPATAPANGQPAAANGAAAPAPATADQPAATPSDQNVSRTYELGREVAVSNSAPGSIKRLSVAVVISNAAKTKPADIAQLTKLISAAVGAKAERGDQVAVVAQKFQVDAPVVTPFYEQSWFSMLLRNGIALIGVLLIGFFGLKPAIAAIRRKHAEAVETENSGEPAKPSRSTLKLTEQLEQMPLADQLGLAQRYMNERPDSAVATIRQMLGEDEAARQGAA